MENVTVKQIQWITRYESIEYIFFCTSSVLTFFMGYIKSLSIGCKWQNNT